MYYIDLLLYNTYFVFTPLKYNYNIQWKLYEKIQSLLNSHITRYSKPPSDLAICYKLEGFY